MCILYKIAWNGHVGLFLVYTIYSGHGLELGCSFFISCAIIVIATIIAEMCAVDAGCDNLSGF